MSYEAPPPAEWKVFARALVAHELLEEAEALEDSLIEFFAAAWPELDSSPFTDGWHFHAVAEHLEAVSRGDIKKLLINLPPRFGKSLLTSVAWPAWLWAQGKDPNFPLVGPQTSIMALSYSGDLALDHALKMKRLVQSDWYQRRWGRRVQLRTDKEAVGNFDTTAGGSRISTSFGGTTTGRGASVKIIDDPHKVKEAESQKIREQAISDCDDVLRNRVADPKTSCEVIVMQRVHEGDLSGHLLAHDPSVTHLCLPAEFEVSRHCLTYVGGKQFWADPRVKEGELLWPEQWPASTLAPLKTNEYTWAGQYQQRPQPKGGGVIKAEWWQHYGDRDDPLNELPANARFRKHPSYSYVIGVLDTAYTEKQENDPSAMAIWGIWADGRGIPQVMLAHHWKERLVFPDLMTKVLHTARKFKIDTLLVEDKTAGHPVVQELQRKYSKEEWNVELIPVNRASGDKTVRLSSCQPIFIAGQVWAPIPKAWAEDFVDEVSRFPRGLHDECVDLTSMGLKWLRRQGLLETEEEIRNVEEEERRTKPQKLKPLYPGTS